MRIAFPLLVPPALLAGCSGGSSGPHFPQDATIDFVGIDTPVDLTPDGSVALLLDSQSEDGDVYLCDTDVLIPEMVTVVGSRPDDRVTGISSTLRVSALHGDPLQAGLWTSAGGWLDLGSPAPVGCADDIAATWDLSSDGSVAVGMAWDGCDWVAMRWTDDGGPGNFTPMEVLGHSPFGSQLPPKNRANVVSDDGTVAAGFAEDAFMPKVPARWHADGSGALMYGGGFPLFTAGEALAISEHGTVIAGTWDGDAFAWSAETGVVDLGRLSTSSPAGPTAAHAIAADGQLIFGTGVVGSRPKAFVWTAAEGMRVLQEIAVDHGANLPDGYRLTDVVAASSDGSIVLGTASDGSHGVVTYVLRMPVSAYGL